MTEQSIAFWGWSSSLPKNGGIQQLTIIVD